MRILLEHQRSAHYNPKQFSGGVEKWVSYIFELLSTEHDVTLLVPGGKEYEDPRIISTTIPKYEYGKQDRYDYTTFYDLVDHLIDDYDVFIHTSMMGSGVLRNYPLIAAKTIYIQHYYEKCNAALASYTSWMNHLFIIQQGGLVLAPTDWVVNTSKENFLKRMDEPRVRRRMGTCFEEYFSVFEKHGLFNGRIDLLHHLENAKPLVEKPERRKVVWIGRSTSEKGFPTAIKTIELLDKAGFEIQIFTRNDDAEDELWFNAVELIRKDTMITMFVNIDHDKMLEMISDANILLWTTRNETLGLVGFEAAYHGLRVVYNHDAPTHYLEESGAGFRHHHSSPKKLAKYVEEVFLSWHNRKEVANYFREKYTPENDLKRMNAILKRMTSGHVTGEIC